MSDDGCHRAFGDKVRMNAVSGVVPVVPNRVRPILSTDPSPRRKETGLIVVLEGLVGEFLCFVQLEAPFALRAGGLVVLAPVRCEPIWPSTNCVPMRAVGGCFRHTGEVYHLRHRVDHPKFLPQSFQVVLDDLSVSVRVCRCLDLDGGDLRGTGVPPVRIP